MGTDPEATVHIITGSAGCREKTDGFIANPPPWSVVRSSDYGFTLMQIANSTHLSLEQMSVEPSLHSIDKFWLVKNSHQGFAKDRATEQQCLSGRLSNDSGRVGFSSITFRIGLFAVIVFLLGCRQLINAPTRTAFIGHHQSVEIYNGEHVC